MEAEGEDTFIPLWEFNISMRQSLTVMLGLIAYGFLYKFTTFVLPVSPGFALVIWSWVVIATLALAFLPKDGAPLEEYISSNLQFMMSDRKFILMDNKKDFFDIEATDWDEVERELWRQ